MVVRTGLHTSMGSMMRQISYNSAPSTPRFIKVRCCRLAQRSALACLLARTGILANQVAAPYICVLHTVKALLFCRQTWPVSMTSWCFYKLTGLPCSVGRTVLTSVKKLHVCVMPFPSTYLEKSSISVSMPCVWNRTSPLRQCHLVYCNQFLVYRTVTSLAHVTRHTHCSIPCNRAKHRAVTKPRAGTSLHSYHKATWQASMLHSLTASATAQPCNMNTSNNAYRDSMACAVVPLYRSILCRFSGF